MPVNISSDRVFERSNLATEMISGQRESYTLIKTARRLAETQQDALGDIYVKYLEPMTFEQFASSQQETSTSPAMPSASEQLALSVTNKMLELQDLQTPLTLNAILSTGLLYHDSSEMLLSDLLKKSETIYEYLK